MSCFIGGDYFSSHYHLGPRKFETAEDEQFLFGEMNNLNFLSSPPTAVSLPRVLCLSKLL